MDSGRLILDSSSSHGRHMLFLGGSCTPLFKGAKSMLSLEEGVNKRRPRPFFTTTEELLDEEYYDEQLLDKKRRLTPEQVICLTEKLQERELLQATGKEPGSAIEGQLSPPSMAMLVTQQQTGGDRQSTGSAVVDGLIEGGAGSFLGHVGRGAASEEDAGTSDDGCSYLPGDILEDAAHADNWWAWN